MEPLSIAASIIAVVQISAQVVAVCARYIDGLLDCPQELRHVLVEIATLKGLFESLKILVGCDPDTAVLDEQLQGPVDGCRKAIIELSALLGDAADEVDNGDHEDDGGRRTKDSDEEDERVAGGSRRVKKRRRVGLSMSVRLAWPLKQKRVMRLLDLIGVYKSSIALILSGQGLRDTRVIREQMVVVASKIDDALRAKLLNWLVTINPSIQYNQALDLYEEGTLGWIKKDPRYSEWFAGRGARGLWINGIPGAGKTILSARIASDLAKKRTAETISIYYFCYHGRNHDETSHFLRWALTQMCRASKIVPDEIVENFKMDHEPSVKVLIESLLEVSQSFSRVVMSIDAIDESQKRESFAKLLKKMATDDQFERFRLVITSRPEANIQSQLSALPTISMSNTLVDADIVVYVDQQLNSDSKFQRWSPVLREDIKLALSKGAHGMFRWAACQLGVLRRLNLEWDVRRALTQLPDTLDETYERMLASIAPENKGLVLRALAILCSDTPLATSIRPGALLSALSMPEPAFHFSGGDAMNVGTAGLDDSSSLTFVSSGASDANRQSWLAPSTSDLTIEDLKEMASGLLRITNLTQQDAFTGQARAFDVVTLAHYTVKEYLFSSRSACGSASYFHLSATIATRYCITCIMRAVAWWPLTSRPTAFVAHCSQVWALNAVHADALIASDDELFGLVCQLLDPSLPHYPALVQRGWRDLTAILKSWRFGVPPTTTAESSSSAAPTSCAAGVLTNMVSLGLNLTTTAFLLRHSRKEVDTMAWAAPSVGGPWPVICDMAQNGNNWPLELLIRRGATLRNGHGSLILHAMRRYIATERTLATIRTLLVAGARPDADEDDGDFTVGVHLTPLQLAAYRLQPGVVKLLLEAGADPNRVGRAGGWVSDASLRNWNGDVSPLRIARRRRTHILKYGRPERPTRDVVELLKAAGAKAHPTGPDDNDDDFDDCVSVRVVEVEMSVE